MNLIFLYGPPAVGKLTVANELEKLTDYKNFHNHATTDTVGSVFEWEHPMRAKLVNRIREDIFKTATQANIPGMIFTYVYDTDDQPWVDTVIDIVKSNNGRICFVQLTASKDVLMDRVANPSRIKYRKVATKEKLRELLEKFDLFAQVKNAESLTIDTSATSPQDAAQKIVNHFKL